MKAHGHQVAAHAYWQKNQTTQTVSSVWTGTCALNPAEGISIEQLCVFTLLNAYCTILSDVLLRRAAVLACWVIHQDPTQAAREREPSRLGWGEKPEHMVVGKSRVAFQAGARKSFDSMAWLSFIRIASAPYIRSTVFGPMWRVTQPSTTEKGEGCENREGSQKTRVWIIDNLLILAQRKPGPAQP